MGNIIWPSRFSAGGIDPNWSSVSYLAGFENATTTGKDESSFNHTPTEHNYNIANLPYSIGGKFGSRAYRRTNASSQWISYPDSSAFALGSGNFTIEAWVNFATAPSSSFHHLFGQIDVGTNQRSWSIGVESNVLTLRRSADGVATNLTTGAWTPSINTWYHVAADWDGTKARVYVDGVMKGSSTTAVTLFNSTADFTIGSLLNSGGVNSAFDGLLDEVRVTKGVARYASDSGYTVPTAAFPRS